MDAHRLLGVPSEELGGVRDFTLGITHRLAVLAHDQLGQLLRVVDEDLEAAPQHLRPDPRRGRRPSSLRHVRGVARGDGVGRCPGGDLRELLARGRIDDRDPLPRRSVPPLVADQQLGAHATNGSPDPMFLIP